MASLTHPLPSPPRTPLPHYSSIRPRPPAAKYQVFNLGPASPYERKIDLDRLADLSKPGEYLVQIIYSNAGQAEEDETVWDGFVTNPVFTVVIR